MPKVYEAMLLSQDSAPEATKKFLTDFNFVEAGLESQVRVENPAPIDPTPISPTTVESNAVIANVAVAEAITQSVDNFTNSVTTTTMTTAYQADSVRPMEVKPMMPMQEANRSYVPAPYRAEFSQLSEILLRTATQQSLKVIVVCGVQPEDNAEFVVENLGLALAENANLRIARFDLTSPTTNIIQSIQSESFRIRILKTPIENFCDILSVSGPLPLPRLFVECDVAQMMDMLRGRFDFVLVRADAINAESEVAQLVAHTDGVILVAQKENMTGAAMSEARARLQAVNAKILGAVLNRNREVELMQRVA